MMVSVCRVVRVRLGGLVARAVVCRVAPVVVVLGLGSLVGLVARVVVALGSGSLVGPVAPVVVALGSGSLGGLMVRALVRRAAPVLVARAVCLGGRVGLMVESLMAPSCRMLRCRVARAACRVAPAVYRVAPAVYRAAPAVCRAARAVGPAALACRRPVPRDQTTPASK